MLVSLNNMKTYLGISLATTTYDTFLTMQINIISEAIEGYCGRKFLQNTYVQTFYQDEVGYTNELPLYHYPLISVDSIVESGVEITSGFRYDKDLALIIRNNDMWLRNAFASSVDDVPTLEVTYDAGYASLPYPIQHVVYNWVEEKYNRKNAGISLNFGSDVQRISLPGALSIDFDYSLDTNQRINAFGNIVGNYVNVLDPYRTERAIIGQAGRIYVQ